MTDTEVSMKEILSQLSGGKATRQSVLDRMCKECNNANAFFCTAEGIDEQIRRGFVAGGNFHIHFITSRNGFDGKPVYQVQTETFVRLK